MKINILFLHLVGYITGESGLSWSIELTDFLGLLIITSKGNVYFLNAAGCPSIVFVKNNYDLVFKYRTFYGYLAYQGTTNINSLYHHDDFKFVKIYTILFYFSAVFQTQVPGYRYFCQTCRTSELQRNPSQIASFQGKSEILIRNIRTYSVVPCRGFSAQYLQSEIQKCMKFSNSVLRRATVQFSLIYVLGFEWISKFSWEQ